MFFADDSYIFCKASREQAEHMLSLLSLFEKASGQKINLDKSSVVFSKNVDVVLKSEICQHLRFQEADTCSLYLGLLNMIERNKTAIFGYLKEKLQERINGWDKKFLSKGGKEILLKTVAQSLPNYAMSVFLLPAELCREIERMMCKFWWTTDSKKDRCIHWKSWDNMAKRKSLGGMGFRSLRDFNVALLGNQAWRLLKFPDKLVSRVYKARYYPEGTFLNAKVGANPSFIWRSILEAQSVIQMGVGCRVGKGDSINILDDPWLPTEDNPYVQSSSDGLMHQKVSSLLCHSTGSWDIDLLHDMFVERDINLILSIPVNTEENDNWYWRKEKLGMYSVKSAYIMLQDIKLSNQGSNNAGFWRNLWNLKIPPKVKIFLWRACSNCLPTKDLLKEKRVPLNEICPMCNAAEETILHILVSCSYAASCLAKLSLPPITGDFYSFSEWLQLVFQQMTKNQVTQVVMVCWILWKSRNEVVWKQHCMEINKVVQSAFSVLSQWTNTQDKSFSPVLCHMSQEDGHEHWKIPSQNWIKINTDAAIFEDSTRYSYAYVIRNHKGEFVEAESKCYQGSISPEMAETIEIREALSWIKRNHVKDVEVESDCLQIVQFIRSSVTSSSYLGRLVEECRALLASLRDQNVLFRFIKRSANSVAHYLATYSCSVQLFSSCS